MSERFDLCILGGGTAGFAAAEATRKLGRRAIVISGPGDLGGTCILRGCMPVKALLSATERLGEIKDAVELGVTPKHIAVNIPAMIARKRELVDYFAEDRIAELERYPLVRGCARFVAPDAIVAGDRRIEAARFLIATGSHIVAPDIAGLAAAGYFTSDDALEMTQIPRSLAIVGGGPVGCEFAQYFARLGSDVTLFQSEPQLLRNEDADVGAAIASALEGDGVRVILAARIDNIELKAGSRVLTYQTASGSHETRVAAVMVTSGRVPNVAQLDLAAAGIATTEAGGIAVDAYLRTTNPAVFAAGDVLGRRCLVHVADYAGCLAVRNAFGERPEAADFDRFEVHAIYTQPQVAVAGLTEAELDRRGIAVRVRHHAFEDLGKALVSNVSEGFIKMLVDETDRIRGITIVSLDAIDLIGEAIALLDRGATAREVAAMPHLHPTMGEIFGRVADDFAGASPQP